MALVATFWAALGIWVDTVNTDETPVQSLQAMEKLLHRVHALTKSLKLDTQASLLVLAGLFAVSLWSRRRGWTVHEKGFTVLSQYGKWMKRATVFTTLLASFTMFGASVVPSQANLAVQIRAAHDGFEAWAKALHDAARHDAVRPVYARAIRAASPGYSRTLSRWTHYHAQRGSLVDRYNEAGKKLNVKTDAVQALGTATEREASQGTALVREAGAVDPPVVEMVTPRRAKELRGRATELRARLARETVETLKSPIGKKLGTSGMGALLNYKRFGPLNSLGSEYAILGPIFDVVSSSFGNALVRSSP